MLRSPLAMVTLLRYSNDHICKIENGTIEIPKAVDHFFRFAVIDKTSGRYCDLHDLILNGVGSELTKI